VTDATLADHVDAIIDDERRRAVRALLRRPFLTVESDGELLVLTRRHRDVLVAWFQAELGYRLVVDSDFARLLKTSASVTLAQRNLATRSGHPFDPRRYALFCLILAALEQAGEQTTLERLAEAVKLHAADLQSFELDFDRIADRRAFTYAVQAAADIGVLDLRDGSEERFARKEEGGDALYQIHHRRLAQVLASPMPPSGVEAPADIGSEAYPDTSEGRARASRHRVMRILVEDAICYFDRLSEEDRMYLTSQRSRLFRQLERMCGFEMELRAEGVAAIDCAGDTSDLAFPSEGTVSHAALLLADHLAARHLHDQGVATFGELEAAMGSLIPRYRKYWRADLVGDPGELTRQALDRLEAFRLIERIEGGIRSLPAIGRFKAVTTGEPAEEPA
jgi:uncharacterized protein (TIGR02678 family)